MKTPGPASPDLSTAEWDKVFKPLLFDLGRQKCVLLLGPEVPRKNGKPLRESLWRQLEQNHKEDIAYFHERDNLFLFPNKAAKSEVQRSVSLFYEEEKPDPGVYETIAALPFALTISISPDQFLLRHFPKNDRPHFAFFNHIGQNNEEALDAWERTRPLVYNLCGSFEEDVSMVLDHDDLFRLLQTAMGTPGLPKKVRRALGEARSFFFLGFDFDKWYTQLLLRLLSEDNTPMYVALSTQYGDKDNQAFLLKQFNIKFISDAETFLGELNRRWQEQQNEAEAGQEKPDKYLILKLLKEGKTGPALDVLLKILTVQEDIDQAVMTSNWYNSWVQDRASAAVDSRDLDTRYNRVVKSIQDLANAIPDSP